MEAVTGGDHNISIVVDLCFGGLEHFILNLFTTEIETVHVCDLSSELIVVRVQQCFETLSSIIDSTSSVESGSDHEAYMIGVHGLDRELLEEDLE